MQKINGDEHSYSDNTVVSESELIGFFRINRHTGKILHMNEKILEIFQFLHPSEIEKELTVLFYNNQKLWNSIIEILNRERKIEGMTITYNSNETKVLNLTFAAKFSENNDSIDVFILKTNQDVTGRILKRDRKAFQILAEAALNSISLKELGQNVINGLTDTFGFDVGSVLLFDDENKEFNVLAYFNATNVTEEPIPVKLESEESLHAYAGRKEKPIFVEDVQQDSFIKSFLKNSEIDSKIRAIITWPLFGTRKQLLGSLQLISINPREISEKDRDMFKSLAELFALAIERANAEKKIQKMNEELELRVFERTAEIETVNKELEAFSYSVSHDLRAPLRHIAGFVELINRKIGNKDDEIQHYIDTVIESSKEMSKLIDDLLYFSRISRFEMKEVEINLENLICDIIKEIDDDHREIIWNIKQLPTLSGDPSLIRIVLTNLILNAVKFTKTKDKAIIEIGSELLDRKMEPIIYIKDNGVGFDMKYYDKLFGVFQRLHNKKEFEGTGIGLATVKRIISKHNGSVWAESLVGQGSTFYFTLGRNSLEKEAK